MAIDKALDQYNDEPGAEVHIEVVNPDAVAIETEDGGAIVILGPELSEQIDPGFNANLAEHLSDQELGRISSDLVDSFESDLRSRNEWERTYKKGLDLDRKSVV